MGWWIAWWCDELGHDRVMGYQSFQGASTPADAVFKSVKGWKERGKGKHLVVNLHRCGACGVLSFQGDRLQAAVQTLWHWIWPSKSLRNSQITHKAWGMQSTVKQWLKRQSCSPLTRPWVIWQLSSRRTAAQPFSASTHGACGLPSMAILSLP